MIVTWAQCYKEIFNVEILGAEIGAILLAEKCYMCVLTYKNALILTTEVKVIYTISIKKLYNIFPQP